MTMIDGKTFGVVTETGVQVCGIRKATPKVMNDLEAVAKVTKINFTSPSDNQLVIDNEADDNIFDEAEEELNMKIISEFREQVILYAAGLVVLRHPRTSETRIGEYMTQEHRGIASSPSERDRQR
ncbi:hypothetical protein EVAR_87961_1 [Eumeta japonica]|uniref:Uncharacterized protein n=1 Tax=Eumeta variegata TaxID=151549 RepID=A0A4C1VDL4_EUMVA|nr:hypothetical protein EVAR_87961_1 [Eumeta japonica]